MTKRNTRRAAGGSGSWSWIQAKLEKESVFLHALGAFSVCLVSLFKYDTRDLLVHTKLCTVAIFNTV